MTDRLFEIVAGAVATIFIAFVLWITKLIYRIDGETNQHAERIATLEFETKECMKQRKEREDSLARSLDHKIDGLYARIDDNQKRVEDTLRSISQTLGHVEGALNIRET